MILASMVMAQLAVGSGMPGPLALLVGLVVGLAAGALNGFLVTRFRLPPFIVTLGTLNIFIALTLLYSGGSTVRGAEHAGAAHLDGQAPSPSGRSGFPPVS